MSSGAEAHAPSAARAGAIAVFFAALAVFLVALAAHKPLDHDEHQFVASGALLARDGLLPYRDFPYYHLPYLTFVYAALFRVTDHLLLGARVFSAACALGALILVFAVVRRAFDAWGSAASTAAAIAFTTVIAVNPLFLYATGRAWNHDASLFLALLAFAFMARAHEAAAPRRPILVAGLALGAAIGVRSTFALLGPGFAAGAVMIALRHDRRNAGFADVLAFGAGVVLALAPLLPLFALAPQEFLYGNLRYNLVLNPGYRDVLGHSVAMSLGGKLDYLWTEVLGLWRNSVLLLTYVACWACLVARSERRYAFEQRLVLALLPCLLLAALSATPSWYQYFYPLVPFLVLGIAFAVADAASMRLAWIGQTAAVLLIAGSVLALRHYPKELTTETGEQWPALALHDLGSHIAEVAPPGLVLTLAPIIPLEGNASIYPELTTGPFAWRTAALVPAGEREELRIVGPQDLERLLRAGPPSAILVGGERKPEENVEDALLTYASEHGYRPEPSRLGFVLWVREAQTGAPAGGRAT